MLSGRGASFKAPDWAVAAGCHNGHGLIDGRAGGLPKDEKRAALWQTLQYAVLIYDTLTKARAA